MAKPKVEFQLEQIGVLPDSIKIGHSEYKLVEQDLDDYISNAKYGQISFHKKTIEYVDMGNSETVDTIVHEVLHGLWRMFDLDNSLENKGEAEEHIVLTLGNGLTMVMKDNPTLFVALQSMLKGKNV